MRWSRRLIAVLVLLPLPGCAAHGLQFPGPTRFVGRAPRVEAFVDEPEQEAPVARKTKVERRGADRDVVRAADYYFDHVPELRDDCSGYVCAVFNRAGLPLNGNTKSLWDTAESIGATHRRKTPRVGDLAFFDDTYDRNHNGIADDELTHIAVVIAVDERGTITLAHGGTSAGRSTIKMNLREPSVHRDENGEELNGYLRAVRKDDPRAVGHLTGELWRGFATVRREDLPMWLDD